MRIALYALILLVYGNVFAAGNDMNSAIAKSLNNQNNNTSEQSAIIYGGKDFSKPVIATANESLWGNQAKSTAGAG